MAQLLGAPIRAWPWTLAGLALAVAGVVVAPPLVLLLLLVFGFLALKDRLRAGGRQTYLALSIGVAVVACCVLVWLVVHH